jgi:uridine kinase
MPMSAFHKHEFTLSDLIERERLVLQGVATNTNAAFDLMIPRGKRGIITGPLLIGIDGSITAGKSYLATRLYDYLTQQYIDCVVIHGDWFMLSRERRKQEIEKAKHGSYLISEYDAVACNFDALAHAQKRIRDFLQTGQSHCDIKIPYAYNRDTGKLDKTIKLKLKKHSVMVIEGTGVVNAEMCQAFDVSIRVDVGTYEETIERLVTREDEKVPAQRLTKEFIKERYDLIDHPYDQYLRSRDSQCFDILLDTSDPASIKVYKRH